MSSGLIRSILVDQQFIRDSVRKGILICLCINCLFCLAITTYNWLIISSKEPIWIALPSLSLMLSVAAIVSTRLLTSDLKLHFKSFITKKNIASEFLFIETHSDVLINSKTPILLVGQSIENTNRISSSAVNYLKLIREKYKTDIKTIVKFSPWYNTFIVSSKTVFILITFAFILLSFPYFSFGIFKVSFLLWCLISLALLLQIVMLFAYLQIAIYSLFESIVISTIIELLSEQ